MQAAIDVETSIKALTIVLGTQARDTATAYRQAQDPNFDTRSSAVRRKAKTRLSQPCGRAITSGSGSLLVVVRAFAVVCSSMSTGGCAGRRLSGTLQVSTQGHTGYDSLSCAVSGFWYVAAVGGMR